MSIQRHRTIVDVLLLLRRGNRILLAERKNTGYADGLETLPSGHLEENESIVDAAIREANEEIGVLIAPEDLRCVHVMHLRVSEQEEARIGFFFEVLRWRGEPVNREPQKCAHIAWRDMDQLPENVIFYSAAGIRAYRNEIPFSTHGFN